MGTFERTYEVDGERFELYAQEDGGVTMYQLVDDENLPVADQFDFVPADDLVAAIVRAAKEIESES